eukprot:g2453.t1
MGMRLAARPAVFGRGLRQTVALSPSSYVLPALRQQQRSLFCGTRAMLQLEVPTPSGVSVSSDEEAAATAAAAVEEVEITDDVAAESAEGEVVEEFEEEEAAVLAPGVLAGTVKWFNEQKGYGFILRGDGHGDVFVHHTEIVWEGRGRRNLEDGEAVEFSINEETGKGMSVTGPAGAPVKLAGKGGGGFGGRRGFDKPIELCAAPDEEGVYGGNVKWFSADKGYGFITPSEGLYADLVDDVFVHHSAIIASAQSYRTLDNGEPVWFSLEEKVDGGGNRTSASNVTGPHYEEVRGQPRQERVFDDFDDYDSDYDSGRGRY